MTRWYSWRLRSLAGSAFSVSRIRSAVENCVLAQASDLPRAWTGNAGSSSRSRAVPRRLAGWPGSKVFNLFLPVIFLARNRLANERPADRSITDAVSSIGVAEVQNAPVVTLHPNRLVHRAAEDAIARNRSAVLQLRDSFHVVTG